MDNIKIKKRGGELEYFSFDKLIASISKVGIPIVDATKLAEKVKKWASSSKNKGVVSSDSIRDKIIEIMEINFPAEADSYKAYKK